MALPDVGDSIRTGAMRPWGASRPMGSRPRCDPFLAADLAEAAKPRSSKGAFGGTLWWVALWTL